MPDITLPYSFATGNVTDADKVAENIYSPNTTPDSFDVINGFLDYNNTSAVKAGAEQIQRGALTRGAKVSRTLIQEFTRDCFSSGTSTRKQSVPIPGCSKNFWTPYAGALLRVAWTINIRTFDGVAHPTVYFFKKAPSDAVPINVASFFRSLDTSNGNVNGMWQWSGSWLVDTTEAGEWEFSINLQRLGSTAEDVVRVGNCSMRILQIK